MIKKKRCAEAQHRGSFCAVEFQGGLGLQDLVHDQVGLDRCPPPPCSSAFDVSFSEGRNGRSAFSFFPEIHRKYLYACKHACRILILFCRKTDPSVKTPPRAAAEINICLCVRLRVGCAVHHGKASVCLKLGGSRATSRSQKFVFESGM